MADQLKINAIEEALVEKFDSLRTAETQKRKKLAPEDPSNYSDLEEFNTERGGSSLDAITYFQRRAQEENLRSAASADKAIQQKDSEVFAPIEELDTATGFVKQTAADVLVGVNRVVGHLASAPSTVMGAAGMVRADGQALDLYEQERQFEAQTAQLNEQQLKVDSMLTAGDITSDQARDTISQIDRVRQELTPLSEDDQAFLNAPREEDLFASPNATGIGREAISNREAIDNASDDLETGAEISEFFRTTTVNDYSNDTDKNVLDAELSATFEDNVDSFTDAKVSLDAGNFSTAVLQTTAGVAKLVAGGMGDLVTNPAATFSYIAENVPQLAIGAISRTVLLGTNLAYGTDIYTQAIDDYKQNNNGALPSKQEASIMLAASLSASAMEQIADIKILNQFGKAAGATDAVKSTFTRLANNGVTRTAGAVASGAVSEGITETYQTAVEENLSRLNVDFDGEALFKGGVIGAAVGGVFSGTGRATSEAAKALTEGLEITDAQLAKKDAQKAILSEAINTGDVTGLVDPEADTYNPFAAVTVLTSRVVNNELTPEEVTATNAQVNELVSKQATELKTIQEEVKKILSVDSDELTDQEITTRTEALKDLTEREATTRKTLTAMTGMRDAPLTAERLKPDDIDSLVEQTQSPDETPERKAAVDQSINLMMQDPGSVNDDQVQKLASSPGLSAEQAEFLTNFSEAHAEINALQSSQDVTTQVLNGRDGFKGIISYETDVANALRNGNVDGATAELSSLTQFLSDHLNKGRAITKAREVAVKQGKQAYVIRDPNAEQGYRVTLNKPKGFQQKTNGGWIVPTSAAGIAAADRIIKAIEGENRALTAASKQITSAIGLSSTDLTGPVDPRTRVDSPTLTAEEDLTSLQAVADRQPTPSTAAPAKAETADQELADLQADSDIYAAQEEVEPATADATPDTTAPVQENTTSVNNEQRVNVDVDTENQNVNTSIDAVEVAATDVVSEPVAETAEDTQPDTGVANEKADEVATVEEPETAEIVEEEIEIEIGNGQLEIFSDTENRISDQFEQRAGSDLDGSPSPLADTKDFMDLLFADGELQLDLLELYFKDGVLTERQASLIGLFKSFADNFTADIKQSMSALNPEEFWHRDFSHYFKEGDEENVRSAISLASFTWIAENGGTLWNGDDSIRAILGLASKAPIDREQRNLLKYAGTRQNLVIQALGKRVTQALGIKAKPDARVNSQAQLELAFGTHALNVMVNAGMLTRTKIDSPILNRDSESDGSNPVSEATSYADGQTFITIAQDVIGTTAIDEVNQLVDAAKDTGSVLNKLFSVESTYTAPSLTPIKFVQEKIKGTSQQIPEFLRGVLKKASKRKHSLRKDMQLVRSVFSADNTALMAGAVPLALQYNHEVRIDAQDSKNRDIHRDIQNLEEFETRMEGKVNFFHSPKVWVQQRVGLSENLVNPQGSKFQRHNITMEAWRSTIDPNEPGETLDQFRLAVAQGMGINVDKQMNSTSLPELDATLELPYIAAAVDILRAIEGVEDSVELSPDDQQTVVDAVAALGENFHSLDAMVNWANFLNAKEAGTEFETDIMFEVDGVTNGPALAHLQLGQTDSKLTRAFGFYSTADGYSGYTDYKSTPGNLDTYELVARDVNDALKSLPKNTMDVLTHFLKDLSVGDDITSAGRKLVKQPLTAMVFGSTVKTAIDDMATAFVESFYEKLENDANSGDMEAVRFTVRQINKMLGRGQKLDLPSSFEAAMELTLDFSQTERAKEQFKRTIGTAVESALDTRFSGFLDTRNELNTGAQAVWARYDAAFEHLYRQKVRAKVKDGTLLANTPKGKKAKNGQPAQPPGRPIPWEDLTQAEIKEIEDTLVALKPVIHSPMSKLSGNLAEGIDVSKSVNRIVPEDDPDFSGAYSAEVKLGTPITSSDDTKTKTLTPRGLKQYSDNPGVRAVIMLVHSLDSAIAATSYNSIQALNIHDALGIGVKMARKAATTLNKNTFQLMSGYSLPLEIHAALARSFQAEAALVAEHPELAKILKDVILQHGDTVTPVDLTLLRELKASAVNSDIAKLEFLQGTDTVDQYALEGGTYQVTAEDKALIAAKLATRKGQADAANIPSPEPVVAAETRPLPEDTPWGVVGEAVVDSDQTLVDIIKTTPTAAELIPKLAAKLRARPNPGRATQFQIDLLAMIYKSANPATLINMVSPDTPANAQAEFLKKARAGYHLSQDGEVITIKDPSFRDSGVTTEMLLHELTHASVAQVIAKYEKGNGKLVPEVKLAVEQLQDLHGLALAYVQEQGGLDQFLPALASVQEMVAWGMTNTDFQVQVLAKVELTVSATAAPKESGLRRLIKSLTKIFFGKRSDEALENGMGVMIANTGLLFAQSQRVRKEGSESLNLNMQDSDPRGFTTDEVFKALGQTDPTSTPLAPRETQRLRAVLSQVTDVVYGSMGALRPAAERAAPATAEDVYLNALANGETPFASKLTAGLNMTRQQAFVAESLELTVRAILGTSTIHRNELVKLYNQARAELSPQDFFTGNQQEAENRYNLLFGIESNATGGSDYLAQFAAASQTYAPLVAALDKLTTPKDKAFTRGQTFKQSVDWLLKRLMNTYNRFRTGIQEGTAASFAVFKLARDMASLEAKRKAALLRQQETPDTWLEDKGRRTSEAMRRGVESAASSDYFKNSQVASIRALGSVTAAVAGDRGPKMLEGFSRLLNGANNDRNALGGELLNEVRNGRDGLVAANNLLDAAGIHEQTRLRAIIETREFVDESFATKLTKEQSSDLTRAVIRTDMATLLDKFSLAELEALLSDEVKLEAEITALEAQVTGPHRAYYLSSGKGLGHFMATGKVSVENLMMNAHNIAFLGNTQQSGTVTETAGIAAIATLDPLISLYALRYTGQAYKNTASDIMRGELARPEGNGVELVLKYHKALQKESADRLFEGSPIHMLKGYSKDIYNPNITVVAATADEGAKLVRAGYVQVTEEVLGKDLADPDPQTRKLYSVMDGGLNKYVTGFMSNTGRRQRGSVVHGDVFDPTGTVLNGRNAQRNQQARRAKQAGVDGMFNLPESFDPTKVKDNLMVPVLNHSGEAVNYRYLMQEETKDEVLQRENRIGHVIGNIAGSVYSKAVTPGINESGIDAIKAHYDADYFTEQAGFIEFSEASHDPEIRERYRLLPDETKRYIRQVWGRNGMKVHKDIYNIGFGYRKYSLADSIKAPLYDQNMMEKLLTGFLTALMGEKAALRIARAEDVWQELVKDVKDIWVIKNLFTLLGNESSNMTILILSGMNPITAARDKVLATQSTLAYLEGRRERDNLQRLVDSEYVTGQARSEAEQKIIALDEALLRNPVRDLVDAGMFQTLIEDIDVEADPYSYKSKLTRWADAKTGWIPTPIKTVGKTVLMTHDTALYKVLNRATVLSDFTSRYVLYNHLTTRKTNAQSKAEALRQARQAFVNYDVPTHKALQYLNDTGLIWFTKYYLRIQAVIIQLVRDNPVRALALIGANSVSEFPDILDSSAIDKWPVNLGAGALEYPGAIPEIITVQALNEIVD